MKGWIVGLAVVGAVIVVASSSSSAKKPSGGAGLGLKSPGLRVPAPSGPPKPSPSPTPKPKPSFPVQPIPGPVDRGLSVGLGCSVTITDQAKAEAAAYAIGKQGPTLAAAQKALYDFGTCGVSEPLKPSKDVARDLYRIEFELWRGAVASPGKYLSLSSAQALVKDAKIRLAMLGLNANDLPQDFT